MKITQFHIFLAKRLGYVSLTVLLVTTVVFLATTVLPGNAATMMLGKTATPEKVAALEQQLGLNNPLHVQYYNWLTGMLTGNAGTSLSLKKPVAEIVIPRAWISVQLATAALIGTIVLAIPLGTLSAAKRNSAFDRVASTLAYIGVSLPEFVTGSLLIILLAGPIYDVFPSFGFVPIEDSLYQWAYHVALPVATLTIVMVAHVMRQTRSELIEVLQSEYVRTARLKGLNERTILVKHALRNGLVPTITILAMSFGYLMGGLVVVETVFAIPGLGRLVVYSIQNRDVPLLQFAILIIALSYTFANLGADLLYTYFDPRIDYGGDD